MMLRWMVVLSVMATTLPAQAREGFYLGVGGGNTSVQGQTVAYSSFESNEFGQPAPVMLSLQGVEEFSTMIEGGPSALYRMGFNILGYGAIETVLSGHGSDLADQDLRQWAAHWHIGARLYPMWHWQGMVPRALRALEPSVFLGWGGSYQVYVPDPTLDELGWNTWKSLRFGLGLEYFVASYFKVGLDYNYINAPYDNFIFNYEESDNYPVNPEGAETSFHQFYVTMTFQFSVDSSEGYTTALEL